MDIIITLLGSYVILCIVLVTSQRARERKKFLGARRRRLLMPRLVLGRPPAGGRPPKSPLEIFFFPLLFVKAILTINKSRTTLDCHYAFPYNELSMNKHHSKERTLVVIKPDGIQRGLIGEVIGRYERIGLKLVGIKMLVPKADFIEQHYTIDPEWRMKTGIKSIKGYTDKGLTPPSTDPLEVTAKILKVLVKYITSGPVVAMVWQGAHAVEVVRKVTGGTEPRSSDVGTIRGDFVLDSYLMSDTDNRAIRNVIHASGTVKEAEDEIKHWFQGNELTDYRLINEAILYDVNLDGILE